MADMNRRRFFQIAGATAGFAALSGSIDRAAAIPAHRASGTLQDVEHIVVLMQENRSFDHYFGALKGVRGFGDPRPVTLPSGKSVWHQADGTGKETLPFHPTADDLGMQFLQGLNHDWAGGHQAYNGGRYDRWIPAKTPTTMAHLTRDDIPFHYALADRFTVCDAYHCSFIGATDPNRYYLWSGHTGNDGTGGGPVLGNEERGYGWTTYPERLEEAGVSWKIYQDIGDGLDGPGGWGWIDDAYRGNYGDNSLLYFDKYRSAQPGNPLYDKARTGTNVAAWRRLLRRHHRRRPGRNTAADLLGRRTGGLHRALQLPLQLRRLVHRAAAGRADVRPRGVEPDRPVHHLRRERRLLRPRRAAPSMRPPPTGACPRPTPRPRCTRVASRTAPVSTGSGRASRCWSSRPGAPAATSAPKPSTTPRCCGSWSSASACASRTSHRGGAPSAAT